MFAPARLFAAQKLMRFRFLIYAKSGYYSVASPVRPLGLFENSGGQSMSNPRSSRYPSRLLKLLAVVAFAATSALAQVRDYNRIVVFGDSLSGSQPYRRQLYTGAIYGWV